MYKKFNISYSTIYKFCKKYNIIYDKKNFKTEQQIISILDTLNIKYIQNTRQIIKPLELDFYLPEYNLAIEVCGLYWHGEIRGKYKNYHLNKLNLCNERGIRLITIFEDELDKDNIIKSRLTHILGKQTNKIHARKCILKELSPSEARAFCNKHHIQGYVNSKYKIGAFYNNILISVMTFGNLRKSTNQIARDDNYELLRFCSANYNISGIASRLLKYFINIYKPINIITYADLRWSEGNLYENLGFKFTHNSSPNYWYTNDYHSREHRFKYRKNVLVNNGYDKSKTEWQIMQERGYDRIWDCGNSKWVWKR